MPLKNREKNAKNKCFVLFKKKRKEKTCSWGMTDEKKKKLYIFNV